MSKIWIHDTETYRNLFLYRAINIETKEERIFQISPLADQRNELVIHLRDEVEMLIGFNSLSYDCPLIHYFIMKLFPKKDMHGKQLVNIICEKSFELIKKSNDNPWINRIKNPYRKQMDLFTMHHFDNKAKRTSLKVLMFVFRMKNVEELPFEPGTVLTKEEIEKVIEYCGNDIEATSIFFNLSKDAIAFRERMSSIYGIDFTNANDVKIGELILIRTLADRWKVPYEEIMQMRTKRDSIKINDIIFPYVSFQSEILDKFLVWWRTKTITDTKGQFNEIDLDEVKDLLPYCNNTLKKGKLKQLNIIYKNFQFDFGTGGLHGAKGVGIWEAKDGYLIDLLDVSSYYPMLAAQNRLHPAHFPVDIFVDVINILYKQRMEGAIIGDSEVVKAIKLALNGALYGKSNSDHSPMYDPQFMMQICLNGQLLLVMIAEQCIDNDIEVIQVNTDGVLIRYHVSKRPIVNTIVEQWMQLTRLKLELDSYVKIIQRDVNNYLGIKVNGKIKRKGVFLIEREFHQNHSQLIVPKAIEEYYINGIKPEIFIAEHAKKDKNLYDFFKLAKLAKTSKLVQRIQTVTVVEYATKTKRTKKRLFTCIEEEQQLPNITRYFVAKKGYKFVKIMPPLEDKKIKEGKLAKVTDVGHREIGIEAANLCVECNNLDKITPQEVRNNLDYDYYTERCYKIINAIAAGVEFDIDED